MQLGRAGDADGFDELPDAERTFPPGIRSFNATGDIHRKGPDGRHEVVAKYLQQDISDLALSDGL